MNNKKIKKIGIDARFYGPIGKGLGRYTQEIVDGIIKISQNDEYEYTVFLRQENFSDFECRGAKVKKILADIKWYGLAEQIIFPILIWRERLDLMHFPHFNAPILCPVKFVITIHDLILIKFPTFRATTLGPLLYKIKNSAYKIVIRSALKRAKTILTVSEYTKQAIIEQFKINPGKITAIYEGVADLTPGQAAKGETPFKQPYLLYVGNAYPHKNLEGLIKIFSKINENSPNLKLILVGKNDYFYDRLKQYAKNFSKNIIFPGYIPDNELGALYENGLIYIFPSFYEGFGLPPLEAMSRGLPVVSSNKTCLPEILGQAALYFNPEDETDMENKIKQAIADGQLRENLRIKGYEQAKKYSWKNCAAETFEIYKDSVK
ncbi:MAG: glycosyltransferase family 1 protein [bacterium]